MNRFKTSSAVLAPFSKQSFKYIVTVLHLVRLLTGCVLPNTPRSKQLLTDEGSNILIYMTGHGGKGILMFQGSEELTSQELANDFEQMWQKRRYNEIFFIIETCDASSMYQKLYSPNILAKASSDIGQNSDGHHLNPIIGMEAMGKFSHYIFEFLETVHPNSKKTMSELLAVCPEASCINSVRSDLFKRDPRKVLITDFFGTVRPVVVTTDPIDILDAPKRQKKLEAENKTVIKKRGYFPQFPMHLVESITR